MNFCHCQDPGPAQGQVQVMSWPRSMSKFKSTTNSKLKFQSQNLKIRDLERHYNLMSNPPTAYPLPPNKLLQAKYQEFIIIYHSKFTSQHCHSTVTTLSQQCKNTVCQVVKQSRSPGVRGSESRCQKFKELESQAVRVKESSYLLQSL